MNFGLSDAELQVEFEGIKKCSKQRNSNGRPVQLDLCPQVAVICPKKRGILVVDLNNFATLCAVWQKIVKV